MEPSQQGQLMTRQTTLWKLVKTMFIPAQAIAKLMVGCGGKRGKGKRRLTLKNMQQAKDAFIRASLRGAVNRSSSRRNRVPFSGESEGTSSYLTSSIEPPVWNETHENITQETVQNFNSPSTDHVHSIPAPLNIAEAQLLLESLSVNDNNTSCVDASSNAIHVQNTSASSEIESATPLDQADINVSESSQSSISVGSFSLADSEIGDGTQNHDDISDNSHQRNRSISFSQPTTHPFSSSQNINGPDSCGLRRSKTSSSFSTANDDNFHGWKQSSIEVSDTPPVTLTYIPSGLTIGDRVVWIKNDFPEAGTVRWIGKIRDQYYAGIQFDKPVGNSSGLYGYGVGMFKRLFTCQLPYGRFVSVNELILYNDYFDPKSKSGIVCIICRDDFLDNSELTTLDEVDCQVDNSCQSMNMVSTKCGHLYHWGCITQWFYTKKRKEFHCPCCSRPIDLGDLIRIFPSQV